MTVYYLSLKPETPANDYWDYGFINEAFELLGYETKEVSTIPKEDIGIVVIPARHHAGLESDIQKQLEQLDYKVVFLMGDEEADFDVSKIKANHIWIQNPHPDKHDEYNRIGTGFPPQKELLKESPCNKDLNVYFSGQVTHNRRELMMKYTRLYSDTDQSTLLLATKGFTQGEPPEVYYHNMARAKVVPCPSGAVIPDSFRVFESLEAMAVPIADEVNPSGTILTYWDWLFGQAQPFPKIQNWSEVGTKITETLENYDEIIQDQTVWWIKYKRDFRLKLQEQLNG